MARLTDLFSSIINHPAKFKPSFSCDENAEKLRAWLIAQAGDDDTPAIKGDDAIASQGETQDYRRSRPAFRSSIRPSQAAS